MVYITSQDAERFCRWLTQKERDAGVIKTKQSYRLPTSAEYALFQAVPKSAFSWGTQWPPFGGTANLAGVETKLAEPTFQTIEDYRDGFAATSPAGSFAMAQTGLYDLTGNVWEILIDRPGSGLEVSRAGGGWTTFQPADLRGGNHFPIQPTEEVGDLGFRCVLEQIK